MMYKTKNFLGLLMIASFLLSCKKDKADTGNTEKIITALTAENFTSKVVPFSPLPSNQYADLMPLVSLWSSKKVIGFGEATHGTSEFHTSKHRMLQLLANELQFKNLTIEDNFSAVLKLNEFVKSGLGDVDALINNLRSSVYKNVEFKNIVIWMKDFNNGKSDDDKLYLFGFDAQNTKYSALAIQSFITQYEPSYLSTFNSLAQSFLADLTNYPSPQAALADLPNLKVNITQIKNHVTANSSIYINGAGVFQNKLLIQHIRIIEQALNQYTGFSISNDDGFEIRDANMAENIQFIQNLRGTQSKVMVWVHNGHINIQKQNYFGGRSINVLGTNLKEIYGSDFYSVGYLFNEGGFIAVNNTGVDQVFTVAPHNTCYLSNAMASYAIGTFFFDLDGNNSANLNAVFDNYIDTYWLGAFYDNNVQNALFAVNVKKEFDGFIFIGKTTAVNPL